MASSSQSQSLDASFHLLMGKVLALPSLESTFNAELEAKQYDRMTVHAQREIRALDEEMKLYEKMAKYRDRALKAEGELADLRAQLTGSYPPILI